MENKFIEDLFKKYSECKTSEEEKALLHDWYLEELKKVRSTPIQIPPTLGQEIWHTIELKRKAKKKTLLRRKLYKVLPYAAVLAIAVLVILPFRNKKKLFPTALVSQKFKPAKVLSASQKENTLIKLPDGSIVILGKGSVLTLTKDFNQHKSRAVSLVGQAFFDIKHNPAKPFIIHTGAVKTVVLGTSFDVLAPKGSNRVTVNVIRGKVSVESKTTQLALLTRNMQIVYDENADKAVIKTVNAEKELAWNKKDMEFNDISFGDAKRLLEERFNVHIQLEDPQLQQVKFTTSLGAQESLEHFLGVLCDFNEAEFSYHKISKTVIIQPLKPN
ncbi:FecR family protein [Pedobacter sp.]|uniref:FecR family protein n=1 Tax=Pedobacter sp. TaxID=1411316 RepID=UPI003D7FF02D